MEGLLSARGSIARLLRRREIAFLVVGGINTVVGLGSFAIIYLLAGHLLHYLVALVLAYAIGTVVGFVLYRRFVFKVEGNTLIDFARYCGVQSVALTLNALVLPLLVGALGLPVLPAQVIAVAVVITLTYFSHLHLTFRRPAEAAESDLASGEDDRGAEREVRSS